MFCILLMVNGLCVENIFERLVIWDFWFPKTAPVGMKEGAERAKMGEPQMIGAVTLLLLASAILKLFGTQFGTQD